MSILERILFNRNRENRSMSKNGKRSNGPSREKLAEIAIVTLSLILAVTAIFFGVGGGRLLWPKPLSSEKPLTAEQINFSLVEELKCEGTVLTGRVLVTNNGQTVYNLSSGTMPVQLGVSIVDRKGQFVNRDYLHLPITESDFDKDTTIPVEIHLENIADIGQDNGLRFAIVQEGVCWFDNTALFYYPDFHPEKYELGTVLSFREEAPTANAYCVSGFSHNEENFTWTEGTEATMRFAVEPTQADLKVVLECGQYGDSQRVGISVNGVPLTQLTIEKDGKHEFTIPGDMHEGDELELRFDLPDATSPQLAGENDDPRLLALRMVSIVMDEKRDMESM